MGMMRCNVRYRAKTGDMLDAICHVYYKGRPNATEAALEANPFLAKVGPVLPEGTLIELPDLPSLEDKSTVVLWS